MANFGVYTVIMWVLRNFLLLKVLDHLQIVCLGIHSVDIIALRNEMKKYHKSSQSIPEYINMLEAAQRKTGRIKKR